jgi:hypothetical protein
MGDLCLNNNSTQLKQARRLNRKVKKNKIHEYEVQDSLRSVRTLDWATL